MQNSERMEETKPLLFVNDMQLFHGHDVKSWPIRLRRDPIITHLSIINVTTETRDLYAPATVTTFHSNYKDLSFDIFRDASWVFSCGPFCITGHHGRLANLPPYCNYACADADRSSSTLVVYIDSIINNRVLRIIRSPCLTQESVMLNVDGNENYANLRRWPWIYNVNDVIQANGQPSVLVNENMESIGVGVRRAAIFSIEFGKCTYVSNQLNGLSSMFMHDETTLIQIAKRPYYMSVMTSDPRSSRSHTSNEQYPFSHVMMQRVSPQSLPSAYRSHHPDIIYLEDACVSKSIYVYDLRTMKTLGTIPHHHHPHAGSEDDIFRMRNGQWECVHSPTHDQDVCSFCSAI